jgi:predicted nicotinamide N-methyase
MCTAASTNSNTKLITYRGAKSDIHFQVSDDFEKESAEAWCPWKKVWDAAYMIMSFIETYEFQTDADKKLVAVDLGSGTGCAGITAATRSSFRKVYLTDLPTALDTLLNNVALNESMLKAETIVCPLEWGTPIPKTIDKPHVILCSELVYFPELFDPLIKTLVELSTPETLVVLCYKQRSLEKEHLFYAKFGKYFEYELQQSKDMIFLFTAKRRKEFLKHDCDDFWSLRLMSFTL